MLRQERDGLPVEEGQQGLVARRPHPIPGAVEGVGHGRAQHVVQVDFGHLEVAGAGGRGDRVSKNKTSHDGGSI